MSHKARALALIFALAAACGAATPATQPAATAATAAAAPTATAAARTTAPTAAPAAVATTADPATSAPAAARGPASIRIVAPAAGPLRLDQELLVRVKVASFTLDGTKVGAANAPEIGHWQLDIDGRYAGLAVTDTITFPNEAFVDLAAGDHEFRVTLRNNDRTPVVGVAAATVRVSAPSRLGYATGSAGAASIQIVEPAAGATANGPLDVIVTGTGVKLDGTGIGKPPVAGVGHWHIAVDGKYAGLSVTSILTIPNDALPEIAAGEHELRATLHRSDHSPFPGAQPFTLKVRFAQTVRHAP